MKIFISWSGNRSEKVAKALNLWLKDVFLDAEIFMSAHNITAGTRWEQSLSSELETSNFGILCLTAENLNAPWILFEAGSLAKVVNEARVIPYRLNLKATDIEYPLAQFHGVDADEEGTFKLLDSINKARDAKISEEQLRRLFNKWWPDLEAELNKVPSIESNESPQRAERELLEEILQIVRQFPSRAVPMQPPATSSAPPSMWVSGKSIHSVTDDEIAAMTDDELKVYLVLLDRRYEWTSSRGEEDVLEGRMATARAEFQRRSVK